MSDAEDFIDYVESAEPYKALRILEDKFPDTLSGIRKEYFVEVFNDLKVAITKHNKKDAMYNLVVIWQFVMQSPLPIPREIYTDLMALVMEDVIRAGELQ